VTADFFCGFDHRRIETPAPRLAAEFAVIVSALRS
jgi:hypothetical protein